MKDKITCPKCEGSGSGPDIEPFGTSGIKLPGKCSLCHGEGKVDPAELFEVRCKEFPFNINCAPQEELDRCYNYCERCDLDDPYVDCTCSDEPRKTCADCKGTGWRPMTADEVEEYRKQLGQSLYTLPSFVKWNQEHGHGVPYNGNPVRLREGK